VFWDFATTFFEVLPLFCKMRQKPRFIASLHDRVFLTTLLFDALLWKNVELLLGDPAYVPFRCRKIGIFAKFS
jgi:hypothetical protein